MHDSDSATIKYLQACIFETRMLMSRLEAQSVHPRHREKHERRLDACRRELGELLRELDVAMYIPLYPTDGSQPGRR